ncbi:hypothetical protein [Sphingomonas fuzhouensis]|uniref:hypothetical protein n=1 Tax=Sphingomonas fuzhouensis TaxID=3106033 RepID=UPI002AFEBB51|nr:hypothetical protein [Sphingomonas sp. SGZ-02]
MIKIGERKSETDQQKEGPIGGAQLEDNIMRKRRGYFDDLFNLSVGGELAIAPETGESTERALRRLKGWASKQKAHDRAYRMKIDSGIIRVQRTPMGRNTVLSDWLLMKGGDRLLLKTKPTKVDIKRALGTVDHLGSQTYKHRLPGHTAKGAWYTGVDRQGRLIAMCIQDKDGNYAPPDIEVNGPFVVGWNGEWP